MAYHAPTEMVKEVLVSMFRVCVLAISFVYTERTLVLLALVGFAVTYWFATRVLGFGAPKKTSAFLPTKDALFMVSPATQQQPHRFYYQEKSLFTRPMYCNVCMMLLTDSAYCCGICEYSSHERCLKKVENSCKYTFLSPRPPTASPSLSCVESKSSSSSLLPFQHQLVVRNHSTVHDLCIVCRSPVGSLFGLHGLNCLWCHLKVHDECRGNLPTTMCSGGRLRQLVLPPTCVQPSSFHLSNSARYQHNYSRFGIRKRLRAGRSMLQSVVSKIRHFNKPPAQPPKRSSKSDSDSKAVDPEEAKQTEQKLWDIQIPGDAVGELSPLVVFINPKAGGQTGYELMRAFMAHLNPVQVYVLNEGTSPMAGLRQFYGVPRVRVLACGGDGTVAWVLSCVHELYKGGKLDAPPVGVLPLGTGNDLAISLGWGGGYSGNGEDVVEKLAEIMDGHVTMLDRWDVGFKTANGRPHANLGNMVMNNYLGLGIDAQMAARFHALREAYPEQFQFQFLNKVWYTQLGTEAYFWPASKTLERIEVFVDGERVDLSEMEFVLIINIPSYGGGSDLWGTAGQISNLPLSLLNQPYRDEDNQGATTIATEPTAPSTSGTSKKKNKKKKNKKNVDKTEEDGLRYRKRASADSKARENERKEGKDGTRELRSSSAQNLVNSIKKAAIDVLNSTQSSAELGQAEHQFQAPACDDRMLEVVGVRSALHMGLLQMGVARSARLAQGKTVRIVCKEAVPLQIDGEPLSLEEAGTITVTHRDQALMLRKSDPGGAHEALREVFNALESAVSLEVISKAQRAFIMSEIAAQRQKSKSAHLANQ